MMLYRMNRFTLNDKFDILVGALEQGSKYFDKRCPNMFVQ